MFSVYEQTHTPKEIIVVDDGSTDDTSNIKKDFPNIKYIYQKNSGVSFARNTGVKNSKSKWVAFLDSDDQWHIDKLKKQVKFHYNNPNILMSFTDELWIRDSKELKVPKKFQKYEGDIFEKCLSHCIIAPSSVLINKQLFNELGLFDENLEVCEDYDLWLRIAKSHKIGLVDQKLIIKYAGHDDQLSFKYWGMDRFRVSSLEKLLLDNHTKKLDLVQESLIIQELIKKYKLLLKGAIKYDRFSEIQKYKKRLTELNSYV